MALALFVGLATSQAAAGEAPGAVEAALAAPLGNQPASPPSPARSPVAKRADLAGRRASDAVREVADWVMLSGDNQGLPFVIVDKVDAEVFAFNQQGRLSGAAPALLGLTRGDDSTPGIGDKKLSEIGPDERTTPAGRFVASLGQDLGEKDVVWVDYKDAIAMHRVITTNPKEHRLQRLATPSPLDKRISYGCINLPVAFYDTVIRPAFIGTNGIIYILPEIKSIQDVFPRYYADKER